jgi:hypothetical protein
MRFDVFGNSIREGWLSFHQYFLVVGTEPVRQITATPENAARSTLAVAPEAVVILRIILGARAEQSPGGA